MKIIGAALAILLAFLLGCTQSQGYASSAFLCKGYFTWFYLEKNATGIEQAYEKAGALGLPVSFAKLNKTEFKGIPISCPAVKGNRNVSENGNYCGYSENGTEYRKDYRYFAFGKKNGTEKYSFSIYERCDGRLSVNIDYSGPCKDEKRVMGQINETMEGIGIKIPADTRLVKNAG